MTDKQAYKKYVARLEKRYPNEKTALPYDKWLPLYKAGLS
jgi:hypothetical protein